MRQLLVVCLASLVLFSGCANAGSNGTPATLDSLDARRAASPASTLQFTVTDLGVIDSYRMYGTSINRFGHVAGVAHLVGANLYDAIDFSAGGPIVLPGGAKATDTEATGINDAGMIAGFSGTISGAYGAYTWTNDVGNVLSIPSGWRSALAFAINTTGDVAGYALPPTGAQHAVMWKGGIMGDLGVLRGKSNSEAFALNSSDAAVGDSGGVAVVFENGSVRSLGSLGGLLGSADAINDKNVIAGGSFITGGQHQHAFRYVTTMVDLGTLTNRTDSFALGINNLGHVVGYSSDGPGSEAAGFLYLNGKMLNLNALLVPNSGWYIKKAYAINGSDQITGLGDHNAQKRAFLLTPVNPVINYISR